jgi:hypothetical protein
MGADAVASADTWWLGDFAAIVTTATRSAPAGLPADAGTLTLNADGSFSYTPAADYNGPDSFTYKASGGGLDSNTATVSSPSPRSTTRRRSRSPAAAAAPPTTARARST